MVCEVGGPSLSRRSRCGAGGVIGAAAARCTSSVICSLAVSLVIPRPFSGWCWLRLPRPRRASRRGGGVARSRMSGAASGSLSRAQRGSRPRRAAAAPRRRCRRAGRAGAAPPRHTGSCGSSGSRLRGRRRARRRACLAGRPAARNEATSCLASSTCCCRSKRRGNSSRSAPGSAAGSGVGSRVAGTLRKRSRWTLIAASSTPRNSSGEGDRRRPCSTAFAKLKVCRAVSQSPNSLLVGNRAIRVAAANATAEASSTSLAPSRSASSRASRIAAAFPSSTVSTSARRPSQPPCRPLPPATARGRRSNARLSRSIRSIGFRQAFASSIRAAPASCAGSEARTASARSEPAM